jgi:predicted nucleotidyltransferase
MSKSKAGLGEVLFGKARRGVIGLLFGRPGKSFYLREITAHVNTGVSQVQKELATLSQAGLITQERRGRQVHYRANPESPIFKELRGIAVKTFGVADVVREALVPFAGRIRAAFVYGSVAKGTDTADSDIDLMVISDGLKYSDVFPALTEVEDVVGRKVNPTLYTEDELLRKREGKNAFVTRTMERPKIFLIGSNGDLSKPRKPR